MRRRSYSVVFLIATLVFVIAGSAAYAFNRNQGTASSSEYQVNERGQSYGVLADTAVTGQEPDLIAAVTSDGEEGYIGKDDYVSITTPVATREEADAVMAKYEQDAWEAFSASVSRNTGVEVRPEGREVLIDVMFRGNIEFPWRLLTDEQRNAIINILPEGYRTAELAEQAWEAGIGANDYCVPVYAEDGETIIGEMWVR
jgi:hypothetical protein